MNQETLDRQRRANTKEVSLDHFIVEETLAPHFAPDNGNRKRVFTATELKNIQNRKRVARFRF